MKHYFGRLLLTGVALVALIMPTTTLAAVFSTTEVVDIDEAIADDVYAAGSRVTVSNSIADDAYFVGELVEIKGNIGEDVMAAGNMVTVSSVVDDDAFLAGEHVSLQEGASVDDLFAAGRFVEIQSGATVNGNAYLAGAQMVVAGTVMGNVRAAGDVVEIASGATVRGDLVVYSANPPVIAEGAIIAGTVRHVNDMKSEDKSDGAKALLASWVSAVVTWCVVSLVILYLMPNLVRAVIELIYTTTLSSFGIGLVWLILMIPIIIILFMTVIGWPLALLVMGSSFLFMVLSAALLPLVVGKWLHQRFASTPAVAGLQWQHALLGAVVVVSLNLVPLIGTLVVGVMWVAVFGVLLRLARKYA